MKKREFIKWNKKKKKGGLRWLETKNIKEDYVKEEKKNK
jgi:hypothetical protein